MTKQETIQVLQSIEDRAINFPNMTECDWVAIAAAKRHLENSIEMKEVDLEDIIDETKDEAMRDMAWKVHVMISEGKSISEIDHYVCGICDF